MRATARRMLARHRYQRWWERSRSSEAREQLRAHAVFCEVLRELLAVAGIDPGRCKMLGSGEAAAATLAAIPDTSELQRLDAEILAQNPQPPDDRPAPIAERDRDSLLRAAQGYAGGKEPDWATCSLADAHAFCVARLAPEAWGLTRHAAPHQRGEAAGGNAMETAGRPRDNPAATA
jgi:hypothetical protein